MTDEPRFNNPFAALAGVKVSAKDPVAAEKPAAVTPTPAASAHPAGKTIPRAVVRMERSGRGGKEVTVVEQLELSSADREKWLKALKSALGCGGVIEGDNLVLQGDHRERLPKLLAERGVRKITASN